jgi:hypothetical protein
LEYILIRLSCSRSGSDRIKFILLTTGGSKVVKKYTLPFPIGCEKLRRVGEAIEINPF